MPKFRIVYASTRRVNEEIEADDFTDAGSEWIDFRAVNPNGVHTVLRVRSADVARVERLSGQ